MENAVAIGSLNCITKDEAASTSYGRINEQFENIKCSFIAHFSLFTEKMAATYSFIGKLIYHTQLNLTENDIIPKKLG